MRLISAGSLVRAQSGPFFARVISRERRLSRRSLGEGGPQCRTTWASYDSASQPIRLGDCGLRITGRAIKTENKQTARDLSRETVQAPETRKYMPGSGHAPVATPA